MLPGLAGGSALAVAVIGAVLIRDASGLDGVNSFVESLSGESSSFLGNLGLPLGFAFAAGMVATVNPCGFAMLPAYLGLYLGSNENSGDRSYPPGYGRTIQHLARALLVGGMVTAGFVLLFGVAGVIIGAGANSLVGDIIPWFGLATGFLVTIAGSWLLGGGRLYTRFTEQVAAHVGDPGDVSARGYFMFGLSYGIASLGCALPIFLLVVGTTLTASSIPSAVGHFFLFALGMGLVIMALTVGMALFKGAMVGTLRKSLRYIQPVSAGLMIVAGSYIVYYWLTIGELAESFEDLL